MGGPSISQPSAEKQDINQLVLDMPKWKPWLSDQSWEEWVDFLDSGVHELEEIPSNIPEWSLQILVDHAQQTSGQENQDDDRNTILLAKERQECTVSLTQYYRPHPLEESSPPSYNFVQLITS